MEDYYHRQHKERVWEIADEFDLDARTAEILDLILRGRFDPIRDLKNADFALKSLIRMEEEEVEAMRSGRPDDLPTLRPMPKSADASNALSEKGNPDREPPTQYHNGPDPAHIGTASARQGSGFINIKPVFANRPSSLK